MSVTTLPVTILPATTALLAVDLQNGVVGLPLAPHSGAAVVRRTAQLAAACRAAGMPVVLVRVSHEPDGGSALAPEADAPFPPPVVDPHADATSALSAEEHDRPLRMVFPRIARVVTTAAVLEAIGTVADRR